MTDWLSDWLQSNWTPRQAVTIIWIAIGLAGLMTVAAFGNLLKIIAKAAMATGKRKGPRKLTDRERLLALAANESRETGNPYQAPLAD